MLKYCNYCSFLMKFIYKWELGSFREPKTATIVLISTYLPTFKDRYTTTYRVSKFVTENVFNKGL